VPTSAVALATCDVVDKGALSLPSWVDVIRFAHRACGVPSRSFDCTSRYLRICRNHLPSRDVLGRVPSMRNGLSGGSQRAPSWISIDRSTAQTP
jgi:hypothetical protein